jgi:hypothetical protein
MSNERLIDQLSQDLKPVRRRKPIVDAAILVSVGMIELGLFLAFGFMRPDMPEAMHMPSFWWKLISLGLIAFTSGAIAVLSLDPTWSPRRGLRGIMGLIVLSLAAGWVIDASRDGFGTLLTRLDWHDGIVCFAKMVVLSIPVVIGLGVLMWRGAPTDRTGTALASGLAAAAWGAFVFVFACPFGDPFYVAVWYSLGCGAVTLVSRALLPRLTRW